MVDIVNWNDPTAPPFDPLAANAEETLRWALELENPREAESAVVHLDRHQAAIEELLSGRGRWAVLKAETARGWLFGPLGFVGPMGAIALGIALGVAWLLALTFPSFMSTVVLAFIGLRLSIVKPDHRDWFALGTPLGAGIVAAWAFRCQGAEAPARWDKYVRDALIKAPEYWHDLAGRAIERLPLPRREAVVLAAFSARSEDLWHMLPFVPTDAVVRAALSRGPRSSATADFHAFQTLIQRADVAPVLEAIRAGAANRDVLIRAVAASGSPAAVALLVATLAERNEHLRSIARDGLVQMGPIVLPQLFEAFELDNLRLQQGVARVLRGMGPNPEIERFGARMLARGEDLHPHAASELRRVVLTRRTLGTGLNIEAGEEVEIESLLASIPAPPVELAPLRWRCGPLLGRAATDVVADLAASEGPEHRCAELAAIRPLLDVESRDRLRTFALAHSPTPAYAMVLADEAELLHHHHLASQNRASAEEWVDVLERHASLAAVHALDDLWRTGVDGVVQTSAMAALMRISGKYDGLEFFADHVLRDVLVTPDNPVFPSYSRGQFSRFEQMMVGAKRVASETFRATFMTVPAQHVLWGNYDAEGNLLGTFRLDEEFVCVNASDEPVELDPRFTIGVVHPAELGPRITAQWMEVFCDYELVAPFQQLQRTACHLTKGGNEMLYTEFNDTAPGGQLEAALIRRGWRPSPMDIETVFTFTKPVQRGRAAFTAVIELEPGLEEDPEVLQRIECVAFSAGHHHVLSPVVTKVRLEDVDPVIFSEIVLELTDTLSRASSREDASMPAIPARLD